jgi:uncharacterized protein
LRLFLDANVLFSAAASPDGVAPSLLTLAGSGACELVTSSFAVVETERNLRAKAPAAVARWNRVRHVIAVVPEADPRVARRSGTELPEKDRPILAAAVACGAHVLVTGDRRHFGPLIGRAVGGTAVLAPREALAWLLSELETKG